MNDETPETRASPRTGRAGLRRAAGLAGAVFALLVPCVAVLDVPLFDRLRPRIFGVPFIDAYLLFWVLALVPFLFLASHLLPLQDEP